MLSYIVDITNLICCVVNQTSQSFTSCLLFLKTYTPNVVFRLTFHVVSKKTFLLIPSPTHSNKSLNNNNLLFADLCYMFLVCLCGKFYSFFVTGKDFSFIKLMNWHAKIIFAISK
jgi:hypothetical protein